MCWRSLLRCSTLGLASARERRRVAREGKKTVSRGRLMLNLAMVRKKGTIGLWQGV